MVSSFYNMSLTDASAWCAKNAVGVITLKQRSAQPVFALQRQKLNYDEGFSHYLYGVGTLVWLSIPRKSHMNLAPHCKSRYQVVHVLVSGGQAALTYRIVHSLDPMELPRVFRKDRPIHCASASQTVPSTPFSVMSPVASHFQHFVMIRRFLFCKKEFSSRQILNVYHGVVVWVWLIWGDLWSVLPICFKFGFDGFLCSCFCLG